MTNKYAIITLALVITIGAAIFSYKLGKNSQPNVANVSPTPTLTPAPSPTLTPASTNNKFTFNAVNMGDKVGEMTVQSVKTEEGYITVNFDGKVEISGDYVSDYSGMAGQYITLNLDEQSKSRIPYEQNQEGSDIVLDPAYQSNKDLLNAFGKTGAKGKFKIEIDSYYVTNWIESIQRVARISKIIEVAPEK